MPSRRNSYGREKYSNVCRSGEWLEPGGRASAFASTGSGDIALLADTTNGLAFIAPVADVLGGMLFAFMVAMPALVRGLD
jgi:hypothetical protein